MRPARLAIAVVAAALAAGLVQAPALAETPAPATPAAGNVVLDEETGEPIDTTQPPVDPAVPAPTNVSYTLGADFATISFTAPVTDKVIHDVVFTDVIPKSPSGKILRRMLRDQGA